MSHRLTLAVFLIAIGFAPAAESTKYEVEVKKDIAYHTGSDADKERNVLDVYVPKGKKDIPVFFFVHGGAWKQGNKRVFAEPAKRFAEAGIAVVCPNYRLSPKVQHPGHIEDVAKAFAWTIDNIAKHGGDPKKVIASGHSAGGHLVALLATNETYLKAEKKSLADIRGVFGISGVYIISPASRSLNDAFGTDVDVCKTASPIAHIGSAHPPMLLVYADNDIPMLGSGAEFFAKGLKNSKQEATAKEFKDRTHITIMSGMKSADDPVFLAAKEFVLKHAGK